MHMGQSAGWRCLGICVKKLPQSQKATFMHTPRPAPSSFSSSCVYVMQEWRNEGKKPTQPKFGYVCDTPGKALKLKVNTTSPTGNKELSVSGHILE